MDSRLGGVGLGQICQKLFFKKKPHPQGFVDFGGFWAISQTRFYKGTNCWVSVFDPCPCLVLAPTKATKPSQKLITK